MPPEAGASRPESRASRPESRASRPESRTARPESRTARPESRASRPESRTARPESSLLGPDPHPLPPGDLGERWLPLVDDAGPWVRLHLGRYDPIYFGRAARNRFDAPDRGFGVLYLAADAFGAFIECFGRPTGTRIVAADQLRQYHLAEFRPERPLHLVDVTAEGLARIGADEGLCSGTYEVSQAWALALWSHPARPDGIRYRARHDPARLCVAVFERPEVVELMRASLLPLGSIMAPPLLPLLGSILDLYGIGLV